MLLLCSIVTVTPACRKRQARCKTIHPDRRENRFHRCRRAGNAVGFGSHNDIFNRLLARQGHDLFARALQGLFSFRIAAILGSIDEKIELNRKKIAELEALAKTIYDYWFVQFDFPDKNGKPYKSSGGKMVWNEQLKREIPEGWEVKSIGSIETNIVTGKTPNTDDATNFGNDIPFLTIDDLRGHVYTFTSQRSLSEKGAKLQSSKFIPPNSLCVSCIGTIGEISFSAKCSQTNQQINSIVFDDDNYREYIYFNLKQYFRSAIVKTGNTFANMNKGEFARILCLVPSK